VDADQTVDIATLIARHKYQYTDELTLQDGIEAVLQQAGVEFDREFSFNKTDRIDFFCADGTGIECKIKGASTAFTQQLTRYARDQRVEHLILVASCRADVPAFMYGVPVTVIRISRNSL
jgi:hypothetical protein